LKRKREREREKERTSLYITDELNNEKEKLYTNDVKDFLSR
jgi:hypothetical protein